MRLFSHELPFSTVWSKTDGAICSVSEKTSTAPQLGVHVEHWQEQDLAQRRQGLCIGLTPSNHKEQTQLTFTSKSNGAQGFLSKVMETWAVCQDLKLLFMVPSDLLENTNWIQIQDVPLTMGVKAHWWELVIKVYKPTGNRFSYDPSTQVAMTRQVWGQAVMSARQARRLRCGPALLLGLNAPG